MSAPRHKPPEPDSPRIPVRLPAAEAALPRPDPGRTRPRDNDPYPVPAPGGRGPSTEESSVAEYEGVRRPAPRQASPNTAGRRQPEAGLPVPQPRPTARPMAQPQPNQYPSAGRSAMRDVPWSGARQIAAAGRARGEFVVRTPDHLVPDGPIGQPRRCRLTVGYAKVGTGNQPLGLHAARGGGRPPRFDLAADDRGRPIGARQRGHGTRIDIRRLLPEFGRRAVGG